MIIASDLKEGDLVDVNGKDYTVVNNIIGDVLFMCKISADECDGFHLFYNDVSDIEIAKFIGIKLN